MLLGGLGLGPLHVMAQFCGTAECKPWVITDAWPQAARPPRLLLSRRMATFIPGGTDSTLDLQVTDAQRQLNA